MNIHGLKQTIKTDTRKLRNRNLSFERARILNKRLETNKHVLEKRIREKKK